MRLLLPVALAALCSSTAVAQGSPQASTPARLRPEWLTGEASRSVTTDGRWIFPRPPYQVLSPERVRELLNAKSSGSTHVLPLREPAAPCGPLYYVQSVYEPFAPTADSMNQRYAGPHYVVAECTADGSIDHLVELADAIDRLWGRGPNGSPMVGPEWADERLSPFAEDGLPVSPERATAFVVGRTHARVDRVPDALAYLADRNFVQNIPACMRWHLHLDRPVRLRNESGDKRATRDVYVNRALPCYRGPITLYVPIDPQPETIQLPTRFPGPGKPPAPRPTARLARPAFFEPATVEP